MRRSLVVLVLASLALAVPRVLAGPQSDSEAAAASQLGQTPPHDDTSTATGADGHLHGSTAPVAAIDHHDEAGADQGRMSGPGRSADAKRHQLTAFLADLERTVAPYRKADADRARGGSLADALSALNQMTDEEVVALHGGLSPLLTSWAVIDASPTVHLRPSYGPVPFTDAQTQQLQGLQADLLEYYDRFEPLIAVGQEVDPNFAERLATLRSTAESLTLEELAMIDESMADVPTWETLLEVDLNQVIAAGGQPHAAGELHTHSAPGPGSGAVPNTDIHPQCKDVAFGPIVKEVLVYLANTAEDLSDIWSNDFFVAAFVGTNAPNIPKIITMAVYYPLKILALAATVDQALALNCNEGYHQALFGVHDGEMLALTDLISGTLTSIDLDLNGRFDRVDAFHARFRDAALRQAIEEDLIRKGDKRISLFQIPESLCITDGEHEVCGMLELAHDIVEDTIRIATELGLDTTNAQASFDDGKDQQSQGFYKEAYTRYREAYVLAVRAQ